MYIFITFFNLNFLINNFIVLDLPETNDSVVGQFVQAQAENGIPIDENWLLRQCDSYPF